MTREAPFQQTNTGFFFFIRVTPKICAPKAAHDRAEDLIGAGGDLPRLGARRRAGPDKGVANRTVLDWLSQSLALPKSPLSITPGSTGRIKAVFLTGDPADVPARPETLLKEIDP